MERGFKKHRGIMATITIVLVKKIIEHINTVYHIKKPKGRIWGGLQGVNLVPNLENTLYTPFLLTILHTQSLRAA